MTQPYPSYPAQGTPPGYFEPPLDQPWYGIGFGQAIVRYFKKSLTFTGRASRGEFWWAQLFQVVISVPLGIIGAAVSLSQMPNLYTSSGSYQSPPNMTIIYIIALGMNVVLLLPNLAVSWRRLHDTGKVGSLALLYYVPSIGYAVYNMFGGLNRLFPTDITNPDDLSATLSYLGQMMVFSLILLVIDIVMIVFFATATNIKGLKYEPRGNDGLLPFSIPRQPPQNPYPQPWQDNNQQPH